MSLSFVFNPASKSDSFKQDEKGYFIETSASVEPGMVDRAEAQGYTVKEKGGKLFATGKFYCNPPTSISALADAIGEEKVYVALLKDYALSEHAKNRAVMVSTLEQKVPKENEIILAFLQKLDIDITGLTFEQKCDKSYLEGLVTKR